MFCRLNPYALPLLYKTPAPTSQAQKLSHYFAAALKHSIQAFKTKKNAEQKEVSITQKSHSLIKMSQSQQKIEKSEIYIPPACQEQKEINKNTEQSEDKKTQKDQPIVSITEKAPVVKPKRRIIRKINAQKQGVKVKKQQKMFKFKNTIREDLISLTAIIPPVKGFSCRQILRRIQLLKKREVLVWQLQDPTTQRRKRLLKPLE